MRAFRIFCLSAAFFASSIASGQNHKPAPAPSHAPIAGRAVLDHLERTIAWYRHIENLEQTTASGADLLLRDSTRQSSLRALQLAFDFAQADATLKAPATPTAGGAPDNSPQPGAERSAIEQVAVSAAQRVTNVQAKITDLEAVLAKANAKTRPALDAQRQELEAELNLAKQIQKTIQGVIAFAGSNTSTAGNSLSAQIAELQKTVPEAADPKLGDAKDAAPTPVAIPKTPSVSVTPPVNPTSEGLVSLIGDMYSLYSARRDLQDGLNETDALLQSVQQLKAPTTKALRDSIQKSDQLVAAAPPDDLAQIAAGEKLVDAMTVQFKQLSTVLVPLGEQQLLTESTRSDLAEWRDAISIQYSAFAHSLLKRLAFLGALIFFILVVSNVLRRATFRYIADSRRRSQFMLMRRFAVGIAITLVVIFSFVTEFGSFATYAGFLTAGLALALQNVILSVVAYFFLIGRYGVRIGDRVTVAGVTGDVIDLGLVRMYMMELAGAGADLHSTGRVVFYSNSVIFQPSAIFKQLPGANYAWRTVILTLASTADFDRASSELGKAVESVYETYRPAIERQHAAFEKAVDVPIQLPHPETRLRYSDTGLEFTARYPVEMQHAATADDEVMRALHDAIEKDPNLALAPGGSPKIQASV